MADLKGQYIYLASPYTHDDVMVREVRYLEACKATAWIINTLRVNAFGTIVHSHSLATRYTMPVEWEFWADYDTAMISHAAELWVLCIPGFTNSMGVQTELKLARKFEKPIKWVIPNGSSTITPFRIVDEEPQEELLYGVVLAGRLLKEKTANV